MTFPDFGSLEMEKNKTSITAAGMSLAMPLFPVSPSLEVTTLALPGPTYEPGHRRSASLDFTLVSTSFISKSFDSSSVMIDLPPKAVLYDPHPETETYLEEEDEIASFRGMLG